MFLLMAILSATWIAGAVGTAGGLVAAALTDPRLLLMTAGSMAAILIAATIRSEE